ncbi:MAG TPA: hypothetical protein V6C81_17615 [Planktothrix sp.]|jgi:hypothetical protein
MNERSRPHTSLQLGELLVEAKLLARTQLDEALRIAEQTALPVGRVLIMTSGIREPDLQAAVQAQSLVKDGLIEPPMAFKALNMAARKNIVMDEALKQLGWKRNENIQPNKLGELLLESGLITKETLEAALNGSLSTGLPLGRFLVLLGAISETLLSISLNAQILIRDGKVTRQRAIEGLKAARLRLEAPLLEGTAYKLPARHTIRLGELFVLAGVVSETDLMNALEIGLVGQKPIGRVLLDMALIDERLLNAALRLQEAVSMGQIRPLQASVVLSQVHSNGVELSEAISRLAPSKHSDSDVLSLHNFLKLVGTINETDVQKAITIGVENSQIFGRMLLVAGVIDESTLQAANRCSALLRADLLTLEQSCFAFNYCQQKMITFDEALQDLGWTQKIAAGIRDRDDLQKYIQLDA